LGADEVLLKYQGLDGEIRRTKIVFNPMPNELEHNSARYRLSLCSNQSISIFVVLSCDPPHEKPTAFFKAMTAARRETRAAGRDYHRRAAELEAQVAKLAGGLRRMRGRSPGDGGSLPLRWSPVLECPESQRCGCRYFLKPRRSALPRRKA
jgi:hypothetical protein